MKKQLITLCLTAFTFSACQQEDLPLAKSIETQEQNTAQRYSSGKWISELCK